MSERTERGMTTSNYTISGAIIVFAVAVVFWGGFVYSQVNENTSKIEENKKKVQEVSKISDDVTEIQVKQRYIRRDVSEIKEILQQMVRDDLRRDNS